MRPISYNPIISKDEYIIPFIIYLSFIMLHWNHCNLGSDVKNYQKLSPNKSIQTWYSDKRDCDVIHKPCCIVTIQTKLYYTHGNWLASVTHVWYDYKNGIHSNLRP